MKKFPKILFHLGIAFAVLYIGIKLLLHFLEQLEEVEEEHREPYQPEEE